MHNKTPGDKNYTRKLTETQVLAIRLLDAIGFSQREIAKRFDVTHVTIHDILTGRTWKDV